MRVAIDALKTQAKVMRDNVEECDNKLAGHKNSIEGLSKDRALFSGRLAELESAIIILEGPTSEKDGQEV